MNQALPSLTIVRHGETEWSATGRHTGRRTDIPLTAQGERKALKLKDCLALSEFAKVWTSPLKRARRTCELAGFGARAEVDADLVEWDYGDYEGRKSADIRAERSGWNLFRDGCPNGETAAEVGARADRAITRIRAVEGRTIVFSSGHILRVLAARWLGLAPSAGALFKLDTASISVLAYEHSRDDPAIALWNETADGPFR